MSEHTKILLADDHHILLDGLSSILNTESGFKIVGRVDSGDQVLPFVQDVDVDILVMDLNMPEMDGIEVLKALNKTHPSLKVIILSSYQDLKLIQESIKHGALGYLTKQSVADHLIEAIHSAIKGDRYYSPQVREKIIRAFDQSDSEDNILHQERALVRQLSLREMEVLQLIARQYTSAEIAEQLYISKGTVDTHRKNLIRKLMVKNAVGLGLFAERNGLI